MRSDLQVAIANAREPGNPNCNQIQKLIKTFDELASQFRHTPPEDFPAEDFFFALSAAKARNGFNGLAKFCEIGDQIREAQG